MIGSIVHVHQEERHRCLKLLGVTGFKVLWVAPTVEKNDNQGNKSELKVKKGRREFLGVK